MREQEEQKIIATLIFQIMGRPPEHLIKTLEVIIDQVDKEPKIKVKKKVIKEPQKNEENSQTVTSKGNVKSVEFYSSFAEIEIESEGMMELVFLLFKYMPAHIEITHPEYIVLSNGGWNDVLNDLIRKLHGYDEIARVSQIEKSILEKRLREILDKGNNKDLKEGVPNNEEKDNGLNSENQNEKNRDNNNPIKKNVKNKILNNKTKSKKSIKGIQNKKKSK